MGKKSWIRLGVWVVVGWGWLGIIAWSLVYRHPMIAIFTMGLPMVTIFIVMWYNDPTRPSNLKARCPTCGQPIQ